MYTQIRNQSSNSNKSAYSAFNRNRITERKQKDAILAMGMSACQARCLSCGHCAHHCGK